MTNIIDTHGHILKKSYGKDLKQEIEKIKNNNLKVINISYDIESSIETLSLYKEHNFLYPVIGIHPGDIKEGTKEELKKIEDLINEDVVAIGEIGLDYHYETYDKKQQKYFFVKQIEIAQKHNLPIVIHTRDSLVDAYNIIKKYKNQKFLLHSWSGDIELTKKFLKISNNIYFSYNGILTFKNAKLQKEVIKEIPLDKLMFETDCPFLSPEPYRGKVNISERVKNVIEYASTILEKTFDELNKINNKNTKSFFNIEV